MLLLVSNMDDSKMDDKKYVNSHLFFFPEAKTFKCLPNSIEAQHTYIVFGFLFIYIIHFIEIWVTGMPYYLSVSLLTLVNRFIFTSKQSFIK